MNAPLDNLLTQGKILLQKVRRHYPNPDVLPPDQQVTVAEVNAWYRGVESSLETAFGTTSHELRTWKFRREESVKRSWEAVGSGKPAEGESFVVQLLTDSIGILAEIKFARAGMQQPTHANLPLKSLHPKIAACCTPLFVEGLYEDAVFRAFRTIEEELRTRTGSDPTDLGVSLISKAMGQKSPILRFRAVATEQEAVHSLFRGAIGAFKNPSSHRSVAYPDPTRVLEVLAFASLLMHMLDAAEVP